LVCQLVFISEKLGNGGMTKIIFDRPIW